MSRNQKAPLFAFVLVALVCGLVLVDTMRAESRIHQLEVLSPSQLGPAYFLAPGADPIAPTDEVDGSTDASGAPTSPDPDVSGPPDSVDQDPTDTPGDDASGPLGDDGGTPVPDTTPSDDGGEPAEEPSDEPSDEGELFPPSVLPGVKDPFVAFTIFGPAGPPSEEPTDEPTEEPTQEPTDEPSEEPTTDADPDGDEVEPGDPGGSGGPDPHRESPSDGPGGPSQPAAPDSAP